MQLWGTGGTKAPTPFRVTSLRQHVARDAGLQRRNKSGPFGFLISISLVFCATAANRVTFAAPQAEGIRLELPASQRLKVENQFGSVRVDVWSEREIAVQATIDVSGSGQRSPLVVERRDDLLLLSVERFGTNARVDLIVRIPENARAEIVTGSGEISSQGLPVSLALKTVSGDIHTAVLTPLDADISASSTSGIVRSELESEPATDPHLFQSRFGTGKRILLAKSQSGEITLSAIRPTAVSQRNALPPELQSAGSNRPGAGTPANQSPNEEFDEGDTIRVDSQLVTMNMSVIDRGTSRGLLGLTRSDFKLFEDGVEQPILQFDSASAPFDLVLLIDLSGSTRDVVKLIRAAARRFVDAARPSDRIAVITFAGRATVLSPLTLDREALRRSLDAMDTLAGDTKLYDAGSFAMEEVLRQAKNSRRVAIVLMSDGLDGSIPGVQGDGSKIAYPDLLARVREFDGVFYNLWLDTYYEALNDQDTQPEAFDAGYERMKELAEAGGGVFYEVGGLEDLAGAYERVVADLGTVYSLTYRPANKARDGKWRAIRVNVARNNAVARGKRGYYAN